MHHNILIIYTKWFSSKIYETKFTSTSSDTLIYSTYMTISPNILSYYNSLNHVLGSGPFKYNFPKKKGGGQKYVLFGYEHTHTKKKWFLSFFYIIVLTYPTCHHITLLITSNWTLWYFFPRILQGHWGKDP